MANINHTCIICMHVHTSIHTCTCMHEVVQAGRQAGRHSICIRFTIRFTIYSLLFALPFIRFTIYGETDPVPLSLYLEVQQVLKCVKSTSVMYKKPVLPALW